jgi:hypothetical protein
MGNEFSVGGADARRTLRQRTSRFFGIDADVMMVGEAPSQPAADREKRSTDELEREHRRARASVGILDTGRGRKTGFPIPRELNLDPRSSILEPRNP